MGDKSPKNTAKTKKQQSSKQDKKTQDKNTAAHPSK